MRDLTRQQKALLDEFAKTLHGVPGLLVRDIVKDLMPTELWEQLQEINDTEVLYQNCNNYLYEKVLN